MGRPIPSGLERPVGLDHLVVLSRLAGPANLENPEDPYRLANLANPEDLQGLAALVSFGGMQGGIN